ncbi:MAG: hypothetical protein GXO87_12755 [Chlorobi bacterium]|nr:hypothetical protein [Chlorobiota bacterium]
MKKSILALLALVLLFGCSKESQKEKMEKLIIKPEKSEFIDSLGTKLDSVGVNFLRYKFRAGDEYFYRVSRTQKNFAEIKTDTTAEVRYSYRIENDVHIKVTDVIPDGSADLEITVTNFNLEIDNGFEVLHFTSDSVYTGKIRKMIGYDEAVFNNPFSVTISNTGKILLFNKVDGIVEKYLEFVQPPNEIKPEEKEAIKDKITKEIFTPLLKQIFRPLPEKEFDKNLLWYDSQLTEIDIFKVLSVAIYQPDYFYVPKETPDTLARIAIAYTSSLKKEPAVEQNLRKFLEEPKISGNGFFIFDLSKSAVQEGTSIVETKYAFETTENKSDGSKVKSTIRTNIIRENRAVLLKFNRL